MDVAETFDIHMASRKRARVDTVRTAGSWMAILAATTLGGNAKAGTVHAEVRMDEELPDTDYRLIVQSYDAATSAVPGDRSKPVGSIQRAVTADELRRGVKVDLLELRVAEPSGDVTKPMVVAWIEDGKPDLEFDGRMARPTAGSVYGAVRRDSARSDVRIKLSRKIAA